MKRERPGKESIEALRKEIERSVREFDDWYRTKVRPRDYQRPSQAATLRPHVRWNVKRILRNLGWFSLGFVLGAAGLLVLAYQVAG